MMQADDVLEVVFRFINQMLVGAGVITLIVFVVILSAYFGHKERK